MSCGYTDYPFKLSVILYWLGATYLFLNDLKKIKKIHISVFIN